MYSNGKVSSTAKIIIISQISNSINVLTLKTNQRTIKEANHMKQIQIYMVINKSMDIGLGYLLPLLITV